MLSGRSSTIGATEDIPNTVYLPTLSTINCASVCYLIFHPLDMYKYDFLVKHSSWDREKWESIFQQTVKKKSIILNKSDTYLWNCKRIKQTVIFFLTYSWLPWVVKHRAYYVYGSKYSANKNSPNNELFQKFKCLLSSQELLYLLGNVSSMPSWSVHSYNINKILLCLLCKNWKERTILPQPFGTWTFNWKAFVSLNKMLALASIPAQSGIHEYHTADLCLLKLQVHTSQPCLFFIFSDFYSFHHCKIGIWAVVYK